MGSLYIFIPSSPTGNTCLVLFFARLLLKSLSELPNSHFPTSPLDSHSWLQHRYPWRETVMRTFHPYSSPRIQMPDAALQQQLHPNSSSSSPPPASPTQPSLDLLVNPTSSSPPSHTLANKNGEQIQQSSHIQSPQSSSNNGIQHSQPPVISAPPSMLSNPDPNASLQAILAANRKDPATPDQLHQWGIPPVQTSTLQQHSSPHIAPAIGQVSRIVDASIA